MKLSFFKYHGTGNDFVMVDNRSKLLKGDENAFFAALCHRRFGIGADGVILLNNHADYDFEMDYFNSDGNRSSMCGNGGRCIVQLAHDLGVVADRARFIAVDGPHEAFVDDQGVKLKMGLPHGYQQLSNGDHWIHTGSPHLVQLLNDGLGQLDVKAQGSAIRYSDAWKQEGTNVNFVQIQGLGRADVRTYERGVEDETWSCGTGVTAVAEVMRRIQKDCPDVVQLQTPGGLLKVHTAHHEAPWLEGPAKFVFAGTIEIPAHV